MINNIHLREWHHWHWGDCICDTHIYGLANMMWHSPPCHPKLVMDLLPDTKNCALCMRRECRKRFHHHRGLAIPKCITAHASRTCRDACWDRSLAVFWRGKHSRHSLCMRNPQFNVSGKRSMLLPVASYTCMEPTLYIMISLRQLRFIASCLSCYDNHSIRINWAYLNAYIHVCTAVHLYKYKQKAVSQMRIKTYIARLQKFWAKIISPDSRNT